MLHEVFEKRGIPPSTSQMFSIFSDPSRKGKRGTRKGIMFYPSIGYSRDSSGKRYYKVGICCRYMEGEGRERRERKMFLSAKDLCELLSILEYIVSHSLKRAKEGQGFTIMLPEITSVLGTKYRTSKGNDGKTRIEFDMIIHRTETRDLTKTNVISLCFERKGNGSSVSYIPIAIGFRGETTGNRGKQEELILGFFPLPPKTLIALYNYLKSVFDVLLKIQLEDYIDYIALKEKR